MELLLIFLTGCLLAFCVLLLLLGLFRTPQTEYAVYHVIRYLFGEKGD